MRQPHHPDLAELTLPRALGALSDPVRLAIVAALADGSERGWGDFDVPVGKSTLSHHMKTLREAGVTRTRMEGTRCFVALRPDFSDRFPGLLPAVLALAGDQALPDRPAGTRRPPPPGRTRPTGPSCSLRRSFART